MIKNWDFFIGFVITLVGLLYYVFFLARKQLIEIFHNKDVYSRLRVYILASLIVTIITLAPTILYQIFLALGYENRTLRGFVVLTSRASFVSGLVLLHLIWTYKVRR